MNLEYYQQESPFYFIGKTKRENKEVGVFCKMWRDGDRLTNVDDIKQEMAMMKLAISEGVPCPDLLEDLSKINYSSSDSLSSSSSGVYHMIVMSKLRRDKVLPKDALTFSISLVSACLKLHNDAGVLHCDVKPGNLSWDSTTSTVSLLDFGHAQLENGAQWYGGTRGYEAPEIVKSEEKREPQPHSRASDAYSVGKTLLTVVEEIRGSTTSSSNNSSNSKEIEKKLNTVHSVAEMLCKEDVSERLSLSDAKSKLENSTTTPVNSRKVVDSKGSPNSVMSPTPS